MAEQFANNAASTLNGAINNSTTTIVVATGEGSRFPSVGNFRLMIGLDPFTAEIVLATARTSDTITVVRGQESTSAQPWGNGTAVTHIVTAGAIEQIRTQFVTVGDELYTTKTVSIDPNGTVASSHGDGYSKLFVNGNILATKFSAGEIPATVQTFSYVSDTLQAFVVPVGVTSIKVKMWGPGGGTGNYSGSGGGGPGGFSTGYLSVTPGEILYLAIGSGGKRPTAVSGGPGGLGGWPGGGYGTAGDASGGGGGGFTGIFNTSMTQGNALMIAGGGGGSTGFGSFGAGGGGGTTGGSGTGGSGLGGTQSAGGLGGGGSGPAYSNGSALAGGVAYTDRTSFQPTGSDCGGGGSGYFGGGAGQSDGRAGGGGSGFLHVTRVIGGTTTTGSNANSGSAATLPPSTTDPYYVAGKGVGGAAAGSPGSDGGEGYVVFQWGGISSLDVDSVDFGNGSSISTLDTNLTISPATGGTLTLSAAGATGAIALAPGNSTITLQSASDFILSSATTLKLNVNSAQKLKLYTTGAIVIGPDSANNDTASEAQAGLTGPVINISSATGSVTTDTNQATIFNIAGAINLQGHTEVRFNTGSSLRGYFDSNGIFRDGPSASSTATLQGATWPITGTDHYWQYNSSGSSWAEIIAGGSANRAALQVWNNATSNTCGVSLFGAGTGHGTAEYAGNGTIEQSGSSTSALVFAKKNGTDGLSFASTGAIWQSGAWTIGRATNNDTSAEAQASLTGPLINLTSGSGTFSSVANQALIFNQSGALNLQGNTEVRFNTSTTLKGYFDSNGSFRIGPNAATQVTKFTSDVLPDSNTESFYSYNASSSNTASVVSGATANRAAIEALNTGAGTTATVGLRMMASGTTEGVTAFAGNGVFEQHGTSTSAIVFSKTLGDGTSRATTGRIYQSGAWAIGENTQNDTSSEAQAGLTGPLLNLTQTSGGSLTTVSNQALLYNTAGVATLQGNSGHNFITSTTSVASTNADKFITSLGRRQSVTTTTANLGVTASHDNIFVGTLSGTITITLPASPTTGDVYLIKDRDGSAAAFNIVISGNGTNVEQFTGSPAASLTLNQNYDSVTLMYNGSTWSII